MEELYEKKSRIEEAYFDLVKEMSKLLSIGEAHPKLEVDYDLGLQHYEIDIPEAYAERKLDEQVNAVLDARSRANNAVFDFDKEMLEYQNRKAKEEETISQEYFDLKESKTEVEKKKEELEQGFDSFQIEVGKEFGSDFTDSETSFSGFSSTTY